MYIHTYTHTYVHTHTHTYHSIESVFCCPDKVILSDKTENVLWVLSNMSIECIAPMSTLMIKTIKIKTVCITVSSLDAWLITLYNGMTPYHLLQDPVKLIFQTLPSPPSKKVQIYSPKSHVLNAFIHV